MRFLLFLFITQINLAISMAQNTAFTVNEKDLILEGIAYDSLTNTFYLSSIHKNKIIQIKNGKTSDFIKKGAYGFVGGVGLHVDVKRRILWACSGNIMGKFYRTGIFAFDLNNHKLIQKYYLPSDTIKTFFNDLTVSQNGNIYVTNTFNHSIWQWHLGAKSPIKLDIKSTIEYPNGITISTDNKYLFVAARAGLTRISLDNNLAELLPMPQSNINSKGLDGLVYYKNTLIGVQNGVKENKDMKIVQYFLSEQNDKIERIVVLDSLNSNFDVPTTLTIAHDKLYVIANSQIDNFDQEKLKIIDRKKLQKNLVLKYKLSYK